MTEDARFIKPERTKPIAVTAVLILALVLSHIVVVPAGAEENPAEAESADRGFLNSLFVTAQFGGGMMVSAGAGLAFFDNVVRPELLLGYTPEGEFTDFSVSAKLNTRLFAIPLSERVGVYGGLGTNFTFFSGNARVASAAFLSQEIDVTDLAGIPAVGVFIEEHFYFVESEDSSVVFQLGLGLRASLF